MLTSQQQASFKQQLQRQKQELLSHLEQNDHYDLETASFQESVDELSNYDNHPGDNASYLYEREKDIALNEHAEDELKNINHALERMNQGSYGQCEECGKDIPIERLEALPTTTFCIEHSRDQEEHERRPVEEEIIQSGLRRMSDEESETNFYDSEDSWQDVARYGTSETPSDFSGQDIDDYSDTYINSDEPVNYVEDYENFTGVDMYGKEVKVYPNPSHEEYEEDLDESGMMSVVGELHYHETDGYVDEEAKEEEEDNFWK
ncbi:TraR/DksA C4-type zinc finger protein [Pontibacillus sp. HMF3514]|uniref:TraR/DksA C4-type zinc finger protein n=1 Tax=Pontibacillus sp. HMF3514 TaxID=2692425 RepID=UPI00131FA523|nr:TraR/DksA C4-type zinc finger protein [Pontibacillus sp. HMF3514]QHE52643.1 yteA family sporulation protein [Pontibacillus sp. HMF3514]